MKEAISRMEKLLKRTTIITGIIVSLLMFSACKDNLEFLPAQPGMVKVTIKVMNNGGRTVLPGMSGITRYELWGGKDGADEESLLEFYPENITEENATVNLEPGTWTFTLKAYKDDALVLQDELQGQEIGTNIATLTFYLSPVEDTGTGEIRITFTFPDYAGIIEVLAICDTKLDNDMEDWQDMYGQFFKVGDFSDLDENKVVTFQKSAVPSGYYFIIFNFYGEGELLRVISELVLVQSNLVSAKTINVDAFSVVFNNIVDFKTWLDNQPGNTAYTPYNVKLNVDYLGGEYNTDGSVGNALFVNKGNSKYVNLDLSGCYFLNSIEEQAFFLCTNLVGITIPSEVTSIGGDAFRNTNITSVTIPKSVTSIGDAAFLGCTRLASVTISEGNSLRIGRMAFQDCTSLTSVTIPDSVTSIEYQAFLGCTGLTSVTIGSGVTTIGVFAFYGTGLTAVTIPKGVTSIGYGAFAACANLASITVDSSNDSYSSKDDGALYFGKILLAYPGGKAGKFEIPSGVDIIGDSAFRGASITSVTIPQSVNTIESFAFFGCDSLTRVTFNSTINPDNFNYNSFPGDLCDKYLALDGGAGTYERPEGGDTWTKQP